MRDPVRSTLRASLWLTTGLVAGLCLAPLPAATQSDVSRAEFDELSQRLSALEASLGGEARVPAAGGVVMQAPFTVVDATGAAVFTVEAENGVVVVNVGGDVGVSLAASGQDGAKLEVNGGIDRSIELVAAPAASFFTLDHGTGVEVKIGFLDMATTGIQISEGDDTLIEAKAGPEGNSIVIGAETASQVKLEQGPTKAQLSLGQGEQPPVTLAALADGGELKLGLGEEARVELSAHADEGKLALGGATAAATLTGKGEAGTLLLGIELGKRAKLSNEGQSAVLELTHSADLAVKLESTPEAGQLLLGVGAEPGLKLTGKDLGGQVFAGEDVGKRVQIGITDTGDPVIQVADGDRRVAMLVSDDVFGTTVASDEGAAILGHSSTGWGVHLSKQGVMLAALGLYEEQPLGLSLFANNTATTMLRAENDGGLLTFGAGAKPKVTLTSNEIGGQLEMGDQTLRVQLGTVGEDALVQVGKGDDRAYMVAAADQVGTMATTATGFAEFGKGSKGFGFTLSKEGTPMANLGTYEDRGPALRLFGSDGTQVVGAGMSPVGGGTVRVFPAGGGPAMAQLDALETGGFVGTFLPSGTPNATLDANERMVALFNEAGLAIATLELSQDGTAGNVTLRNSGGGGVFSAGAVPDGSGEACVVRKNGQHCLGIGLPGMGGGN
jgi:hypothetical protein